MGDRPLSIDIKHGLLLKSEDLFLITTQGGSVPASAPGFGLFYHDCCYLSQYALSINGTDPLLLMSASGDGFAADMQFTNAKMLTVSGKSIDTHVLGLQRRLILTGEDCTFTDVLTFRNFAQQELELNVALTFTPAFESIFVLRGTPAGRRGTMNAPEQLGNQLRFSYSGADAIVRSLDVDFSVHPVVVQATPKTGATFNIDLAPQECKSLLISFHVSEIPQGRSEAIAPRQLPSISGLEAYRRRTCAEWLKGVAQIHSDDFVLNEILHRSLSDLRLLRLHRDGQPFIAAGMPWFVGLFGRDSLIPSLQCLAFEPEVAQHTGRLLAGSQGRATDPRRQEAPGKILHELRVGEMAHLGEIPQTPSYASVDSTLLFLILIARHATWIGSLELFHALRENIERALCWMDACARRNGYIEYDGRTEQGTLLNQGWKDSQDAIVRDDGSFPEPPISLVEVQGYAYLAKSAIAALYERAGEQMIAIRLREEAQALRVRFNRDFWMEDKGCYCLALEADGRQVSIITSNAGQALWTGIADADKAYRTAQRLMQEDMFSGWGVRTLSEAAVRYNPFAYQLGSVWPFDNAFILAGLRRYGLDALACRLFSSTLEAAHRFPLGRLPEFFAGSRREEDYFSPAHCPRADPLQAWSAGTVPFMLTELLGLRPRGFDQTLRIVRPVLPEPIAHLELQGIRVGSGSVDLRFVRERSGAIIPQVLSVQGRLKITFSD